ncbi:spore protease YyaC [Bacillus kwashiorkori]|uniref:spore protease YyaC n=1 Tax=Bacillus kwashiorkori TaxID=1522318 RepID=UPI0007830DF5|nr:spore protease YyaC [Bacillus kwashiorkori]
MFKQSFTKQKNDKILWKDVLAPTKIANQLFTYLPLDPSIDIVFICIGTDRSTGDSLGPLVGTFLQEKYFPSNFYIYGTIESPVHAVNLQETIDTINQNHQRSFIVAIDACLGQVKNVGTIEIKSGPLKPGAGVNKVLPLIGDIHITGIVNVSGYMEFFVLQNTRLFLVMQLAKAITDGIYKAGLLYKYQLQVSKEETIS